ncbi:hypothetical protein EYM_01230 [Ignicoccus islandicus DSM 13165]|uniref:Uncharacterized protein n=1 Tax=Ignicoccus islandicus DSM 13165 TaxID=940295 RepID=A0A0U3FPC9_9CREN|nr:hypothetical protein [Ignicoccus islandicus]ALU12191.1 hypothetical protein EYM_01230 [Ignicoccus islandicus DSM 13165]
MWDTRFGTSYLALEVKCETKSECFQKVKEAKETLRPLDESPILTWSDFCNAFFLATRYAFPKERIKEFIDSLEATGWEVVKYEEGNSNDYRLADDTYGIAIDESSEGNR